MDKPRWTKLERNREKRYNPEVPLAESSRPTGFFRYLSWSEADEKWQLVCTDAGYSRVGPYTHYPPHQDSHPRPFKSVAVGRTLSEYQLIYITRGRGIFQSDAQTRVVVPGSILLVLPGVRHFYKPQLDVGWTEYWVGFKGPYADTLREQGLLSPEKPLHAVGLHNRILSIYSQIFELVRSQQPLYQARAASLVVTLIAEILAPERTAAPHADSEQLLEKARSLMAEDLYGAVNLAAIAETLGISGAQLNSVFKSFTSMTPYQYYISVKIQKAKEMLENGGLSIREVASRLGFSDPYYFSRLFRRKVGLPPSRWNAQR